MNSYHNIFPIDKNSAEKRFTSNNVEQICYALISITYYEEDWEWVQDKCLFFLMSDNPTISGLSATCLGHLARIHNKIDKKRVIELLHSRLNDENISGRIQDALNDIEMFA